MGRIAASKKPRRRLERREEWRREQDWLASWDAALSRTPAAASDTPAASAAKVRAVAVAFYEARAKKPWEE